MIVVILRFLFCFISWNLLLFLFFNMYLNVTAFAKLSHPRWQKLITPHFEVVFDEEQKEIALEYAIEAEVVHEILSPYFSEYPSSRTVLYIDSETDEENALATVVPTYFMSVTPKWPSQLPFHYSSWKYFVLIHEYTHILYMSPKGSWLWKALRLLFGNMSYPNIYLPGWYHEGMAVEVESYFSHFGRLNSPFFYSNVRAMVDEGVWGKESISSINEIFIPTWPFGRRRYFYGSILINEISTQEGVNEVGNLISEQARHGSRLALNKVPKRLFGKTYETMLQTAYDRWRFRSEKDLKKLEESPIKESQTLPLFNTSENITGRYGPKISPNGKNLIFIQASLEKGHQIILLTRKALNESFLPSQGKIIAFGENIQSVSWINDEEFVFDRSKTTRRNSVSRFYNDLYKGDISGSRPQRITTAERLQFPSLSWDQTHILAIQSRGGENFLVQVHLKTKDITVLYTPSDPTRLSYPLALTQDEIVFIAQDAYGKRRLNLWNQKTKQMKLLPLDQEDILFLSKVKGGLIYNSAASGVPNLYFWGEKSQKSHPITHSKTAIRNGIFDHFHQELWISQFHADGYRMEVQKSLLEPVSLLYIKIPHSSEKKPLDKAISKNEVMEPSLCSPYDRFVSDGKPLMCALFSEGLSVRERDMNYVDQLREKWQKHFEDSPPITKKYHGLPYLTPYFLFPYYYYWTGGSVFGLLTRGSDPLEHHQYSLHLNYKYRLNALNGKFHYEHYKLWEFEAQSDKVYEKPPRGSEQEKNEETRRTTNVSFRKGFFINDYWTGYMGWFFRRDGYSISQQNVDQYGPELILDYSNQQPDSLFATSENFYISRYFNINRPSHNQINLGAHLVWSFSSPFKFLTRDKQPLFQNSSLRYHQLSLKTDHVFISSKDFRNSVSGSSFFTFGEKSPPYIRGYLEGTFRGWQIHALNLEYTFPLFEIQKGLVKGLLFFKNLDVTLLSDHLLLRGSYFDAQNDQQMTNADRLFSSIGIEAKLNLGLGYSHVHFFVETGLYYGLDRSVSGGPQFAFSIGSQTNF